MHSRILTRRLAASAVAGTAALAVLAPTASAMEANAHRPHDTQTVAQAEAKPAARLTVKSYTTYLKQQKTSEAKKTLNAFTKLPAGKQAKFVKYLQNRDICKALIDQAKGNLDRKLRVVDPYNADVKFVTEVTAKTLKGKSTKQISFTVTETIFGIPVTSETLSLRYQVFKGKVTGTPNANSEIKNVNAAIALHKSKVRRTGHTGVATASTVWKAVPRVKSFGKGVDKVQEITADARTWKAKLANR
ncbi:hypothetical protein J7E91_07630 [Streptomyces sp. ISL-99]|uniref:hypothetical protein n=1 Tax=Streptomyces sp. ISL-99 TaxID=2819193 RepID=UPI001BE75AA6|nr:hypothetical protein [Streptomyces sp. ISL-99]MBT2525308.1 hypothetical protein [Streptomyces sp. ISL-99]